jgi:hypothetical protein
MCRLNAAAAQGEAQWWPRWKLGQAWTNITQTDTCPIDSAAVR